MSPQNQPRMGANFIIFAIIFLTGLIVFVVTYSIYLFIDLTHVSTVANVHITKNLVLATKNAQGKLYTNSASGISDWLVYTDEEKGYEIKYPNDFTLEKQPSGGKYLITLKKVDASPTGADVLSSVVYTDEHYFSDASSLKDQVKQLGLTWNDNWKQEEFGGKPGIRTGEIKDNSGVIKDMVIWQLGGKIFTLETDCFKTDCTDNKNLFDKIISEFKFI